MIGRNGLSIFRKLKSSTLYKNVFSLIFAVHRSISNLSYFKTCGQTHPHRCHFQFCNLYFVLTFVAIAEIFVVGTSFF
jgi:hypothetical protein